MRDHTQLTHDDHIQSGKNRPLSIIADNMSSPLNVGGLFRLCDALGVNKLYLCGNTPAPPNTKINKTSRSTEKHVDYESHKDAAVLVRSLHESGSTIISLEITSTSIDISSDEFRTQVTGNRPVCLILGSENSGVDRRLLALSDITVHIPMTGNNSSMNVITAAAIACFEINRTLL